MGKQSKQSSVRASLFAIVCGLAGCAGEQIIAEAPQANDFVEAMTDTGIFFHPPNVTLNQQSVSPVLCKRPEKWTYQMTAEEIESMPAEALCEQIACEAPANKVECLSKSKAAPWKQIDGNLPAMLAFRLFASGKVKKIPRSPQERIDGKKIFQSSEEGMPIAVEVFDAGLAQGILTCRSGIVSIVTDPARDFHARAQPKDGIFGPPAWNGTDVSVAAPPDQADLSILDSKSMVPAVGIACLSSSDARKIANSLR